ncbi:MAG: phosphodiesterase [Clostridia bacterium]|nr:phosphodiesterase [Clostridia bacterium]
MRIAVASDIHGSLPAAKAFLDRADALGADKILLLGDLYYHGARNPLPEGYAPIEVAKLLNANKDRLLVTRGNCDSDVDVTVSEFDLLPALILANGDKTVFASHGDRYDIDRPPVGFYDLVLYGHYHTCFIREKDGAVFANPGSLSLPKGGTCPAFLLLDESKITLYALSGEILEEHVL